MGLFVKFAGKDSTATNRSSTAKGKLTTRTVWCKNAPFFPSLNYRIENLRCCRCAQCFRQFPDGVYYEVRGEFFRRTLANPWRTLGEPLATSELFLPFLQFEGRKYCEYDFQVLYAPCCNKCSKNFPTSLSNWQNFSLFFLRGIYCWTGH
jgi:hypothetical protein